MSLLARIHANRCRVAGCDRERVQDALVCRDDLAAMWRNELIRQADGSFIHRRLFVPRDLTGALRAA